MVTHLMLPLLFEILLPPESDVASSAGNQRLETLRLLAQPHFRLTVLFCSFLT